MPAKRMNTEELSEALAAELAKPVLDLTLHQIETELAQLIEYRQERLTDTSSPPTEEEIGALDAEIQRYQIAEPAKVAGVAAIFRSWKSRRETAKAEVHRLQQIVKHYELMEARLKDYCAAVLERLPEPVRGCRKLTGKDGSQLMLRGNGGVQPLEITDAEAIPDDLCWMEGRVNVELWNLALDMVRTYSSRGTKINDYSVKRVPDTELIRKALEQPCPKCKGIGAPWNNSSSVPCTDCGGSGKHAIPGARLLDRGVHVECR